ncbi:ABC transporter ATP-binding protein [Pseudonocardia ailaonensis]|uniref:ABC transporter ATP-binding protein n=1 Tax=Pseudonocardia ailaonensis TaxID=367279 RepID=UPI0031DEE8DB
MRPLSGRRLAGPVTVVAVAAATVAAGAEAVAATVVGQVAAGPTASLVSLLAALLLGAAVLDTIGRVLFSGVVGRAEGRLRADLVDAVLAQPVARLEDQAVGELMDRVDDDARELGTLFRRIGWETGSAGLRSVAAWIAAGILFWPAWIAFPLVAVLTLLVARPLTARIARCAVAEEEAWSEHAAQLEEAVAGQDDIRTSLGQPHVVRGYVARAATVLRRVQATRRATTRVGLATGLVTHALLGAVVLGGVWLVAGDPGGVAALVALWLLASAFVAQVDEVANQLPEIQTGLGALTRVSALLSAEREPTTGDPVPSGPLAVSLRGLTAGYPNGFRLAGVDLDVPAGTTCALVGRTGSGKSTIAKVLSRAVEPPPGQVFVGGRDITNLELDGLRRVVGVVTQRTELLTATLAENVALHRPVPRSTIEAAFTALGLDEWVAALPAGLDTVLGVGGTTLSAGEQQLVAFARLLVRDVGLVVLDEATARMDPRTEERVTRATRSLLAGRTGIVIAHRLSTVRHADSVAVLEDGAVVQSGPRAEIERQPGVFAELLAAGTDPGDGTSRDIRGAGESAPPAGGAEVAGTPTLRRAERRAAPPRRVAEDHTPPLWRAVPRLICAHPRWGLTGAFLFVLAVACGATGVVTAWLWGDLAAALQAGETPWGHAIALTAVLLSFPLWIGLAYRTYFIWWTGVTLRLRLAVLRGQTMDRRPARTPPGEVVARALDSERMILYLDNWVDVTMAMIMVVLAGVTAGDARAALVIAGMLALCTAAASVGAPFVGRAGRAAADARARFGGELASTLDAVRTVKLAAATDALRARLAGVDRARVRSIIREQRLQTLFEGLPGVLVQAGIVLTWAVHLGGGWDLATALLVSTVLAGSGYFGQVGSTVVTEAPATRRWLADVGRLAAPADPTRLPAGVDLLAGTAPAPEAAPPAPLERLVCEKLAAVHDDGTIGVEGVDLEIGAGELVLVTGEVGSGKSSLLGALAGIVSSEGRIRWNGTVLEDPETELRPGRVAYVAQVPRVLSGTFAENITLGRPAARLADAVEASRLTRDLVAAGGPDTAVGHRGIRLSGGQVQRLAMARALATGASLVLADDVSSALDARTELELWSALRERGTAVLGASTTRVALERADRVVVLEGGRIVDEGPWADLAERWSHLAG